MMEALPLEHQRKLTIAVLPGTWTSPALYEPLVQEGKERGHQVVVVSNLPTKDRYATYEDYAQIAANQLRQIDGGIDVLMPHSAGGQYYERTAELVGTLTIRSVLHNSSSFGAPRPGRFTPEQLATIPGQRSTDRFLHAIKPRRDGTTRLVKARKLFFNGASRSLGRLGTKLLRPHCRVPDSPMPDPSPLPTWYLMPEEDEVRYWPWVESVCPLIGATTIYAPGDHNIHFSRPGAVMDIIEGIAPDMPESETMAVPRRFVQQAANPRPVPRPRLSNEASPPTAAKGFTSQAQGYIGRASISTIKQTF